MIVIEGCLLKKTIKEKITDHITVIGITTTTIVTVMMMIMMMMMMMCNLFGFLLKQCMVRLGVV